MSPSWVAFVMFYKDSALLLATADSNTKAPVDGSWQLQGAGEARGRAHVVPGRRPDSLCNR